MKVGVFLAAAPSDGGAFQYSLSILHALKDVAGEGRDVSAVYINDDWKAHIEQFGIAGSRLDIGLADSIALKLLKFKLLPIAAFGGTSGRGGVASGKF